MYIRNEGSKRTIILMPGDYYVSRDNVVIGTTLGSCVSVCLYDPVRRIVGMNHFLLSGTRYSEEREFCLTEAGRYGIHAMELVMNGMFQLGAKRNSLHAKAFGGASLLPSGRGRSDFATVGETNVHFVVDFLSNEAIPLIASDLGGYQGRVIRFHSQDFSVFQRKIKKTLVPDLTVREERYWKSQIRKDYSEPEIWGK